MEIWKYDVRWSPDCSVLLHYAHYEILKVLCMLSVDRRSSLTSVLGRDEI
jgi:hypothetical protein